VPDKRAHRGRHPGDLIAFGPDVHARLREAVADLSWLLSRGYADKSSLKIVGDRYNLLERQRIAVMRCTCSDQSLASRRRRQVPAEALAGQTLLIDGYNVLTTVEAALADGIVIVGRDGCYRDMASMHGTFRQVNETVPAIAVVGGVLDEIGVGRTVWYLDRPVSNSGRLKTKLLEIAGEHGWPWLVEIVANPDAVLSAAPEVVASADSIILDRCEQWFGLARHAVERSIPNARIVDCRPRDA
jgi:hypothetical protein